MKTKLYLAILWGLSGAVALEASASVDLFNNPVGAIGVKSNQPDLFNNPVGAIGADKAQAGPATEKVAVGKSAAAEAEAKPVQTAKSNHWAYKPVSRPSEPSVTDKSWVRNPIDAFVLAKLEAKGIKPSPEADRAAFIRRATLDAWGVIPTPEQVQAFVEDTAPNAYEKLADRLLSSPKYGERQARRWLDLARYADSTGFQNDETRPNLWRYRDYVINSFNQDKPYSRFIQEQLAGDEIWPDNQDALIATGYMANFPDNHNSRDLVQRKYQITTDITDTVGKVFLAQTVECARCHNHKFDKISQKDYFSLQSFFANVSAVDNIPVAKKSEVEHSYEAALAKWETATKDIRDKQKAIIDSVRDQAVKHHKERYLTDSREAIFKPQSEWNAQDRWVNHRLAYITDQQSLAAFLRDTAESKGKDKNYTKEIADKWTEYDKLAEDLKKFNDLKPKSGSTEISAMTELGHSDAPPSYVFFGGDHEKPLEQVQPAFPEAITDEKPDIKATPFSSGRRAALANWIASDKNPLTARVFVNRVWEEYFGHGIVETVSDFGKAGQKPTNPELLDYLADNFIKQGWSIKKLHRDILLSSVYRQASDYREDIAKADPDNKLLGVFPRKRLEAEQIRDSLLVASGKLEDKVGGPSVFPPVPANLGAGNQWQVSKDPQDQNRRSLYIFTRRSVPYPLLETFNMASAQEAHSKREVTTSPLQSLALFNSDVVFGWSQALAGRVINEAGKDEAAQLDRLYQILFARKASDSEKVLLQKFLDNHEKTVREKTSEGKFAVSIPTGLKDNQKLDPIRAAAFVDLVHTVANSNEFIYRF
ncbi:MAG: DUF1549 and DUF1553 domain-containing protein [Methylovulum miyakonense]|uniref:DUF1549 and DUF1553 domain-containing protein n=1 Tax=Methylovulum miyakonense TaxID=645578 RepID=UPI003BB48C22